MDSNQPIQPEPQQPAKKKRGGGPRTAEGKRKSSQNNRKHGCCSEMLLLPGESKADFDAQYLHWLHRFEPNTGAEVIVVEQLAIDYWRFKRSEGWLRKVEEKLYATQPDPTAWTAEQQNQLNNFRRYRTADYNQYQRSQRAVEQMRKDNWLETNMQARQTERAFENQQLPPEVRAHKQKIRVVIATVKPMPSNREDGGCTCPRCITHWGVAQLLLSNQPQT